MNTLEPLYNGNRSSSVIVKYIEARCSGVLLNKQSVGC